MLKLKKTRIMLCMVLSLILSISVMQMTVFAATITLPPGSTSADLQTAINDAASGDIIEISEDMTFSETVRVPSEKEITIQSTSGNNWTLTQTELIGHFTVEGSLTLQNIILDGGGTGGHIYVTGSLVMNSGAVIQNCSAGNGGGVDVNGGNLTINSSAVIQNCTATAAGGGVHVREGNFTLNGGSITGNHANDGGGIFLYSGTTTINNATISGNTANQYGGGIYGWLSTFTMENSKVSGNITDDSGGGVLFYYSLISMSNNSINDNEASGVYGGGIYVWESTFTMSGGEVNGNTANDSGGGIFLIYSEADLTNGTVINDNEASGLYGGGIYIWDTSFTMDGGEVGGNTTNDSGAGIFSSYSEVTLTNGIIKNNSASASGGGVYDYDSAFTMDKTEVSGNKADTGGGLALVQSDFIMSGSTVSENTASGSDSGGGIYLTLESTAEITGASSIINNSAPNSDGGGIYTQDENYNNLITSSDTVFRGNTASAAYIPPEDAQTLYPAIEFASTSLSTHPLNNFDINSSGDTFTYRVSYDANGGKGSYSGPGIAPGDTDTVLSLKETEISRTNYTFTGWNTEPDGSGYSYAPGDDIEVNDNVTLYAQWTTGQAIKIVGIVFMFILLTAILVLLIVNTFWVKACVIVCSKWPRKKHCYTDRDPCKWVEEEFNGQYDEEDRDN